MAEWPLGRDRRNSRKGRGRSARDDHRCGSDGRGHARTLGRERLGRAAVHHCGGERGDAGRPSGERHGHAGRRQQSAVAGEPHGGRRRGWGIYGLTVWDPAVPSLARLREIAVYPVDPAYVVEAEYRRTPGREVEIERLTDPPGTHVLPAPAELVFDLAGQRHSLTVIETFPGNPLVVFTDSTSGIETPEIGRWVMLPPVEGDTVRIDFNQAVLPLHVFSHAFPCPLPPAGNHLPVPVPAGERGPVYGDPKGKREDMSTDIKDTAVRYLRRLEEGDYAGMRALCTDTATVWHNDGKGEQSIDENLAMLKDGPAADASLRYDITRQLAEADEVLQQHVLHISNAGGPLGEVQAAMYFRFKDGLIDRIEEYATFIPAAG
ncbi:DUF1684 domain-containing protein [Amycolatopsis eburnea]|uniref:DUF1684 domain-containing protein n=1 Tax=Amycolatopsis eburnea TaxID=2267691 RepID=A0A3R9DH02_9PSEU|nr:DUF1684 domain-containing protein [Amycolatopsis eburnea]